MSDWAAGKKRVEVLGRSMAYVEEGEGDPIIFLHGNPTSSYLWRNVMPALSGKGRLIAPDLIGMGDSDKLPDPGPDTYSFQVHREYLDALLEALGVHERVTLVVHDWGSGLGFDWARRHAHAVRGIAYMEAIVRPFPDWSDWDEGAASLFQTFRSKKGEDLILERNVFVERVLPGSILRKLDEAEMAEYRRPFAKREDRWPTLTWPRSIPVAREPEDVNAIAETYSAWLAKSPLPKLLINAEPGAIMTGRQLEFARSWPNQKEVTVKGSHFIQEDSGPEIGKAIRDWLDGVD